MPWQPVVMPAEGGRKMAEHRGGWCRTRSLHPIRKTRTRRALCAAVALAVTRAASATVPIELRPDWGDLHLTAQTGTIEGYRPITYVMLTSRDARGARCQASFDMHALRPKVFRFRLAPGKTRTLYYDPLRAINRMIIAVHCTPLPATAEPAPETR